MKGGLSKQQRSALLSLYASPITGDAAALVIVGRMRRVTLRALERCGYARYFPTSETWRITKEGRVLAEDILWQELMTEVKEANRIVVRNYRERATTEQS